MKLTSKQIQISFSQSQRGGSPSTTAFTLVELLVVICVIALLVATLVPTLAGSRIGSESFRCLNNNRQLCSAWRIYADDNSDRVVFPSGQTATDHSAWTSGNMNFDPNNSSNWDTNTDIVRCQLWPYTSKDASIYLCPSDHSRVVVAGAVKPRVRSFSLNFYAGGFAGQATLFDPNVYRLFLKTTDFSAPGPAKTFLFVDMRPESINWGNIFVDPTGYLTQPAQYKFSGDLPGIFHNFGASFSFADGRAEIHRWVDPRTAPMLSSLSINSFASPNNPDITWLQAHATGLK
jgi:type II secretory pathway pseudopilin PulG